MNCQYIALLCFSFRYFVFLSCILLSNILVAAGQSQSIKIDSSAPIMSGVNDVLGGQHYLLEDDDLAFVQVIKSGSTLSTQLGTALTSNSNISSVQSTSFLTLPANGVAIDTSTNSTLVAVTAGRMFNTPNDFQFMVGANQSSVLFSEWNFTMYDPNTHLLYSNAISSKFSPYGTVGTQILMGDFNGDGLQDALVFYTSSRSTNATSEWGMRIFTAANPDQPGVPTAGPELYGNSSIIPQTATVAVGDFNNDGLDEIAALLSDGQTIAFYTVDPKSLTITQTYSIKLPNNYQLIVGAGASAQIAGRFRDCGTATCQTNADLALVGQVVAQNLAISVIPVQITPGQNGAFTAQVITSGGSIPFFTFSKPTGNDVSQVRNVALRVAPLANWPKNTLEQLVVGIEGFPKSVGGFINIGTFRPVGSNTGALGPFDWESSTEVTTGSNALYDIQVGNFDDLNSDGTHNPAWQIQAYTVEGSTPHLQIYNIAVPSPLPTVGAPQTNWLSIKNDYSVTNGSLSSDATAMAVFATGDFQSRSLRLGQPTVYTIPTQVQPDLVLAIPPMHVDWIAPGVDPTNLGQPGCTNPQTPCEFNLTVAPTEPPALGQGFTTGFSFADSSKSGTRQSATTSWGISVGETAKAKFTFGDDLAGSSVAIKTAAKYTHDGNVAKTYNTYTGKITQVDTSTVFSDFLFFTQKSMNVYYYPVIGQSSCPNGASSCTTPGQQYVEFSVPDNVMHSAMQGSSQWWYQPAHEPGNILSYPIDKSQLQLEYQNSQIAPLTQDPPTCVGIGASNKYSTTWISGSSSNKTTGSANSFQDEVGITYSSHGKIPELEKAKVSIGLDVSGQVSVSTLNETTSSLDSSQGISVNEPGFNSGIANCCGYGWANYIYGLNNVAHPSAQDLKNLVTDPQGNPVAAADVSPGPLFVGFLADPFLSKPGGLNSCNAAFPWWQQVYNKPDVALNHPTRWTWHVNKGTAAFNAADTSGQVSPLDQQFYQMKGFFITKQDAPTSAPNMPSATAGDQLTLTARVYNYSLVDAQLPVHVRIYGQFYCSSGSATEPSCVSSNSSQSCTGGNLCGDSFEIGETTVAGIPGIKSQSSGTNTYLSNWTTASVNFDTTKYCGDNLVFWVVTWMQDTNGNIVPEMADHGLTRVPATNITTILQEPIENHSNNVGLYGAFHQFYIAPQTAPGSTAGTAALQSVALKVSSQTSVGQSTPVAVYVQTAPTAPTDNINVALYDGNPSTSGRLLDIQRITHVEPGFSYIQKEPFTPETCGVHTLYTAAWLDGHAQIQNSGSVNVTAKLTDLTQPLVTATQGAALNSPVLKQDLVAWLNLANQAFQSGQTELGEQFMSNYVQELNAGIATGASRPAIAKLLGAAAELLGCGPVSFALTTQTPTATVKAGGTAEYVLAVTPTGGFSGVVQFACSGAPVGATCSISKSTVALDGVTQQILAVNLTMTGTVRAAGIGDLRSLTRLELAWMMLLIGSTGVSAHRIRRQRHFLKLCLFAVLFISVGGTIGCSSGVSSSGATPSGAYRVAVTGVSGTITQTSQLTLYVQ